MVLVIRQTTTPQGPAANTSNSGSSVPVPVTASTTVVPSTPTVTTTSVSLTTTSTSSTSSSTVTSTSKVTSSTSTSTSSTSSTTSSSVLTTSSPSTTSTSLTSVRPTAAPTTAATTIIVPDNIVPLGTTTNDVLPSSPVSNAVTGSTQSGFLQNKGAVAATFTFSSLIFVAALVAIIIAFMKRRNSRKEAALHDELFISYVEPPDYRSNYRSDSPGPSINDAPMDPFARREVVYDAAPDMSQAHSSSSDHSHYNYAIPTVQVTPVQHPDYYNPQRYLPPSQASNASSAVVIQPSVSARLKHVSAQSGYQPSVDSFYGAEQPSGHS